MESSQRTHRFEFSDDSESASDELTSKNMKSSQEVHTSENSKSASAASAGGDDAIKDRLDKVSKKRDAEYIEKKVWQYHNEDLEGRKNAVILWSDGSVIGCGKKNHDKRLKEDIPNYGQYGLNFPVNVSANEDDGCYAILTLTKALKIRRMMKALGNYDCTTVECRKKNSKYMLSDYISHLETLLDKYGDAEVITRVELNHDRVNVVPNSFTYDERSTR